MPTARVLLIDPDRDALATMQRALAEAGFPNVAAVPSGSFALTMLERDRPDIIVSRARVPDIDGWELCSIVRSDPTMAGVLFLLLAGPGDEMPETAFAEGPDRMLVGEFTLATIVGEVASLLGPSGPGPAPSAPARPPRAESAHGLRGSLGVMDLPDLVQAIALGNKTGHLALTLEAGPGGLVFERGRIIHAEFGGVTGERAFTAMVVTAHREAGGSFVFNPADAIAPNAPRTVERSVKQLLLGTAAEIDEGRAGSAAIAPLT